MQFLKYILSVCVVAAPSIMLLGLAASPVWAEEGQRENPFKNLKNEKPKKFEKLEYEKPKNKAGDTFSFDYSRSFKGHRRPENSRYGWSFGTRYKIEEPKVVDTKNIARSYFAFKYANDPSKNLFVQGNSRASDEEDVKILVVSGPKGGFLIRDPDSFFKKPIKLAVEEKRPDSAFFLGATGFAYGINLNNPRTPEEKQPNSGSNGRYEPKSGRYGKFSLTQYGRYTLSISPEDEKLFWDDFASELSPNSVNSKPENERKKTDKKCANGLETKLT